VLIPSTVVQSLHDEAQMALLLSVAITTILQKQGFAAWPRITGPHVKGIQRMPESDMESGDEAFSSMQYHQLWRMSARSLVRTGYNPVDAAEALRADYYYLTFVGQHYTAAEYVPLKTGAEEYAKAKLLLNAPAASAQ
jgi:hypothetical protein